MANIEMYVQGDCPYCIEAEKKIKNMKDCGELKCPVKIIKLNKKNYNTFVKKNVLSTPTILVDGKKCEIEQLKGMCKV